MTKYREILRLSSLGFSKHMPDYDYIHKELLRNGVSKKLLWTEYMEDCRANVDVMWLIPSGQVAHATPDGRLCRTRIFT